MKNKHSLFVTSDACTNVVNNNSSTSGKAQLRQLIRLALVGSVLTSNMAFAVLQDHGPSDPLLIWPSWYRDTAGLAIGLCKSTTAFCFPAAPTAGFFAGNIGPEMFYNMVEFRDPNATAKAPTFQYHYLAGLEASYLPAGDPVHGTEIVFARVRMSFNFNVNDTTKNGKYTVTHPFGVQTFYNVTGTSTTNFTGAQASVFFTADVPLGPAGNFDLAMGGPIGPFIKDAKMPVGGFASGTERFVADPATAVAFTGSPFNTNFLRIDGPVGSNLDGANHDFILVNVANIVGQIWTAPIAQPLTVDSAYMTRSITSNAVDVWATSSAGQTLVATGTGMPDMLLRPDGVTPGKYHGHVEYAPTTALPSPPASITISNSTTIPTPLAIATATAAVKDVVEISQASYNTSSRLITVVAKSDDAVTNPQLTVQGIPGVPSAAAGVTPAVTGIMSTLACTNAGITVTAPSVCFTYSLPIDPVTQVAIEPPEKISVVSASSGGHADNVLQIVGTPENPSSPPVATDITATVESSGVTTLAPQLPSNAQIIQQPIKGIVSLVNGQWIFTANAGIAAGGGDKFTFVRQAAINLPVSNLATGNLSIAFLPSAPIVAADQFAAGTGILRPLNVQANDKPATSNTVDAIALSSVTIVTQPTKGSATANLDGTVSYTANATGTDTFTYTVTSIGNPTATPPVPGVTSSPATVTMTNFSSPEVVSITKSDYTTAKGKWVVTGDTTWSGADLSNLTATCWVGGAGSSPTSTNTIGSGLITNLVVTPNTFAIIPLATAPVPVASDTLYCKTTNGGLGTSGVLIN